MPKFELFRLSDDFDLTPNGPRRRWQVLRMSYCLVNTALMWNGFVIVFSNLVGCSRWPIYLSLGTIMSLLMLGIFWMPAALTIYFVTRRRGSALLAPENRLALTSLIHAAWFACLAAMSAFTAQLAPGEGWLLWLLLAISATGILSIALLYLSILYSDWMSICTALFSHRRRFAHAQVAAAIGMNCPPGVLIEPEGKAGKVLAEDPGQASPGIDTGDPTVL
ncbi:MAG TPA: hypothetical protein V6C72_08215 [Chroococcales cyanobacterium]